MDDGSYPIEVAWNVGEQIETHLIEPRVGWNDWSRKSAAVHGISRADLFRLGKPVDFVVERMQAALRGQVVMSDNPEYDTFWCNVLFDAVGIVPAFTFADTNRNFPPEVTALADFQSRLDSWRVEAWAMCGPRHRAGNDVAFWVNLWRIMARTHGGD